jgi:hypothetical protein
MSSPSSSPHDTSAAAIAVPNNIVVTRVRLFETMNFCSSSEGRAKKT